MKRPILKTAHTILGVDRGASPEEIRQAYRTLAQVHHPDKKRGDDHSIFLAINSAYRNLETPLMRQAYENALDGLCEQCQWCDGRGRTYKQKGFTARVAIVCEFCGGAGVTRWIVELEQKPIRL